MAKLDNLIKEVNYSKHGNRFLSSIDMAEAKRVVAETNGRIKRGEIVVEGENHYMGVCSCGVSGCIYTGNFKSIPQDEFNEFQKHKYPHHTTNKKK